MEKLCKGSQQQKKQSAVPWLKIFLLWLAIISLQIWGTYVRPPQLDPCCAKDLNGWAVPCQWCTEAFQKFPCWWLYITEQWFFINSFTTFHHNNSLESTTLKPGALRAIFPDWISDPPLKWNHCYSGLGYFALQIQMSGSQLSVHQCSWALLPVPQKRTNSMQLHLPVTHTK